MSNNPKLVVMNRKDFKVLRKKSGVSGAADAMYVPVDDTIYVVRGHEDNKKLLCHEYGHAIEYPGHDHPEDFFGRLNHSVAMNFDVRSPMGSLRFKYEPKDLVAQFEAWVKNA